MQLKPHSKSAPTPTTAAATPNPVGRAAPAVTVTTLWVTVTTSWLIVNKFLRPSVVALSSVWSWSSLLPLSSNFFALTVTVFALGAFTVTVFAFGAFIVVVLGGVTFGVFAETLTVLVLAAATMLAVLRDRGDAVGEESAS